MVNVRPDVRWLGFPLGLPENSPGFLIDTDGPVRANLLGNFSSGLLGFGPGAYAAMPNRSLQDPTQEALDRLAKLYPDVGGRPFGFVERQGPDTNPIVPVSNESPAPGVALGDGPHKGPASAPTLDPNPSRLVGMGPFVLTPPNPPPSILTAFTGTGRVSFPPGVMLPPAFPGQAAPAERPQPPLASLDGMANPSPMPSFAEPIPGEGLWKAGIGPRDPVAPGARPEPDRTRPALGPSTDPNIVAVAGSEPTNADDDVQIAQQQGTPQRPPQALPGGGSENRQETPRSPSPQPTLRKDPSPGVAVVLPDRSTIEDPQSPTGQLMAPTADLSDVAAAGRKAGQQYRQMLESGSGAGALAYLAVALGSHVGHWGTFDYQRQGNLITGGTHFPQFVKVSNLNVGLFAQQAGLTLEEALTIAGEFAKRFSSNADPGSRYGLNSTQQEFITRGYKVGESGMFDRPPTR